MKLNRRSTATVLTAAMLALTTACSSSGNTSDAEPATPSTAAAPVETSEPTPGPTPAVDEPETSPRGALIKAPGESAGLLDPDGAEVLTFTVNSITVDPPCTEQYSEGPEKGHFVVFDMTVSTQPSVIDSLAEYGLYTSAVNFHPSSFDLIDENGMSQPESDSLAAYGCLSGSTMLKPDIGPGESATGHVVFDSPTPHGTIVYRLFSDVAWEWAY